MRAHEEIRRLLEYPFSYSDIEWRAQRVGMGANGPYAMVLSYVTNRAIQQRLDDVFGCFGWKNEFKDISGGGVECGISIFDKDSESWVTKWDAADNTNIEATKGGRSDSMKRAAVQWGIGRYLYKLDSAFANCSLGRAPIGNQYVSCNFAKKGAQPSWGYWEKPQLPDWALPLNQS